MSSTEAPPQGLGAEYATQAGPYVLNCTYCFWSSKEIGITLDKPNGVYAQLAKIKNGGERYISPKERRRLRGEQKTDITEGTEESLESEVSLDPNEQLDAESQFSNLKSFYQTQLMESTPSSGLGFTGDYGYGSPGALSRIMGLYTTGGLGEKKSKGKVGAMREAADAMEGLQISTNSTAETISRLRKEGWEGTATALQRREQSTDVQFVCELRPMAMLLRTKRSKRCRSCRHILSKPESKVQNTRFRIRLVALNYIPTISIKSLQAPLPSQSSFLTPMKPVQFVLTFRNPLFESVRINIATPAQTPGRFGSKVTVLCPQFEVGANTDVWDEALREGGGKGGETEKRRTKAEASEGQQQAEAGKVWERGRNWVSVVVEVVPASLRTDVPAFLKSGEQAEDNSPLREDEDVLEIAVFVRVEWEAEATEHEGGGLAAANKEKEVREKRELAYWCVLGVGRIAQD